MGDFVLRLFLTVFSVMGSCSLVLDVHSFKLDIVVTIWLYIVTGIYMGFIITLVWSDGCDNNV